MNVTHYDMPREKIRKKGIRSLTNTELVQALLGSGTAQVSIARMAKTVTKLLNRNGLSVSLESLLAVKGLGPARASQILAALELSSRYPISSRQLVIDTIEKAVGLVERGRKEKELRIAYVTVDGARRLISNRFVPDTEAHHPSSALRRIIADTVTDEASGVYLLLIHPLSLTEPSLLELGIARDLRAMSQLFLVSVFGVAIVNEHSIYPLAKEPYDG